MRVRVSVGHARVAQYMTNMQKNMKRQKENVI